MNVGDFSTVFAAQIAAAYPRRSAVERSESALDARRAEREANGREALRPTGPVASTRKVDDEKNGRSKSRFEERSELEERLEEQAFERTSGKTNERTDAQTDRSSDVPRRFWESRVERPGSASFRESTTSPNDELGKRLDVFC